MSESIEDILANVGLPSPPPTTTGSDAHTSPSSGPDSLTNSASEPASPDLDSLHLPLPDSPTMSAYDFETVSFLAEARGMQQPQRPQQKDWSSLLWSDPTHQGWSMDVDVDNQLGAFVDPSSVFSAPHPDVFQMQRAQHAMATPQELAGLAPLLDAFPFMLDNNGFPKSHDQQRFTRSPSPGQSESSMTASEDEIARFARESAGVMQAIVAGSLPQEHSSKLPIPRLGRAIPKQQPSPSSSGSSSASASPPPITPLDAPIPPAHLQSAPAQAVEQPAAVAGKAPGTRPKTSHTTIERRYRTNLNARILALRAAIPATRILDPNPDPPCVPDERGYVDGVKAARKGSKATILAKAVEYITVLKGREVRLRKENDGLRALVSGLVGGRELLAHWEHGWREKYGRVEDDILEAAEGASDDEDSDDEDARPAKKARKAPAPSPIAVPPQAPLAVPSRKSTASVDPITGEKRKRGRPRKNPQLVSATPVLQAPVPQQLVAQQPAQYLLAVFALFSLWSNVPVSQTSTTHTGSVLADAVESVGMPGSSWGFTIQMVHVIASIAVLVAILYPMVRRRLSAAVTSSSSSSPSSVSLIQEDIASDSDADVSSSTVSSAGPATPALDASAEFASLASSDDEGDAPLSMKTATTLVAKPVAEPAQKQQGSAQLVNALGARGTAASVIVSGLEYALSSVRLTRRWKEEDEKTEAWARLAEALVVEGEDAPLAQRFQTYFTLGAARLRSPASRAALSLLAHSLGVPDAEHQWDGIASDNAAERIALSLSLTDAYERLISLPTSETQEGALARLARDWLQTESAALARDTFMCVARGIAPDPERVEELRAVATELGGAEARLAFAVAAAVPITSSRPPALLAYDVDVADDSERETADIVRALGLFRRAFPTAVLSSDRDEGKDTSDDAAHMLVSPPPSPAPRDPQAMLALQQVLGRPTFDAASLEDARDRMVDMVRAVRRPVHAF